MGYVRANFTESSRGLGPVWMGFLVCCLGWLGVDHRLSAQRSTSMGPIAPVRASTASLPGVAPVHSSLGPQRLRRGPGRRPQPRLASMFRSVIAFGDSFTDTTQQGRLPTRVSARFGVSPAAWLFRQARKVAGPVATRFANYGRVGATASYSENWIGERLLRYGEDVRRGIVPQASLILYQGGINDLLARLHLIRERPSPWSRVITRIIRDEILRHVVQLRQLHPGVPVVVWTVPDLPSLPIVSIRVSPAEAKFVRQHVAIINEAIRQLPQVAPEFVVIDGEREIRAAHLAVWSFDGVRVYGSPFHSRFDALFGDALHPSAVFNAYLGNRVIGALNRRLQLGLPLVSEQQLGAIARSAPW